MIRTSVGYAENCVERVMHLKSECPMLAGHEYVKKHNNALKVLITTSPVEKGLLEKDQC